MTGKDDMTKRLIGWALLLMLVVSGRADAATLTPPDGMISIEDEAFANCVGFDSAVIPDGTQIIGARAFSGCAALEWIEIPDSVTTIGDSILEGCMPDVLIRTSGSSAAAAYALSSGVDFQADTVYRALIIGQSYENSTYTTLKAPPKDAASLNLALACFEHTPYEATALYDITSEEIYQAIEDVFSEATENDVSLFYYSGHGLSSTAPGRRGALVGSDGSLITASQLRAALDAIPGRKIVIVDACYSGNLLVGRSLLGEAEDSYDGAEAFVDAFISAFSLTFRAAANDNTLAGQEYFVITASAEDEKSYEGKRGHGFFTYYLLYGAGWEAYYDRQLSTRQADANANGVITIDEAYTYASDCVLNDGTLVDAGIAQHVMCWPDDCDWFGFLRS